MNISNKVFDNIVDGVIEALENDKVKCTLHTNFLYDLVRDVRNFRKTLEHIVEMKHACDCPAVEGGPDCWCPVKIAQEALKGDE